uniref:Apple domain-containing protein n=1 Tax=Macrostomum lignano TaxID=282301 RepID=A0A1I8JMM8_9PLAT
DPAILLATRNTMVPLRSTPESVAKSVTSLEWNPLQGCLTLCRMRDCVASRVPTDASSGLCGR